ncbi:9535_t:CDS:2 [Funneliformis mosseae]|uniref:9535_t:CDS:1 n=1 Tax=Funneliformis mosseae TaxID=27381 RepID=A0A9N9CLS3_FUNMO|nr:9535_t:CDS:2 [Funneliformis mosseae]
MISSYANTITFVPYFIITQQNNSRKSPLELNATMEHSSEPKSRIKRTK